LHNYCTIDCQTVTQTKENPAKILKKLTTQENIMKNITTIAILCTALIQPAFAEKGKHEDHMERRSQHMDRMIEELQLTSEQAPAVKQIMEEQHTKMRSEMEAVHEQVRPKMEALKAETSQRLSTVLTKEQLQTFNSKMGKRHDEMREHKGRRHNKSRENNEN
jgi:Spy/CpxP family protein refolding chaperone